MKRPNIVFVLSDDHGYWANGAYGNKEIITPNIDSLAKEGIKFNNFFCTSPVCSPARASILTGKMPSAHGVIDWICGGNVSSQQLQDSKIKLRDYLQITSQANRLQILNGRDISEIDDNQYINMYHTPEWKWEMRDEHGGIEFLKGIKTYPQILSENGYHCELAGKWHLGHSAKKQAGFKGWNVIARGGTPYMLPEVIEDGKVVIKDQYVTNLITEKACSFLNNYDHQKPFYLSVHYTAPHSPWNREGQLPNIWQMYQDCPFNSVENAKLHPDTASDAPAPKNEEQRRSFLQGYFSAVSAMDADIGKIRQTLEKNQLADNTIFIYCSDNGMSLGQNGVWGKGNGTYPFNFYDNSIKVPFIYYDPRSKVSGIENNTLLSQYDIMPTVLELCAIDYPLDKTYPGQSFVDGLQGKQLKQNPVVVFDEYGPARMIRTERYKYIKRSDKKDELYDLKNDPKERKNVINDKQYREVQIDLQQHLQTWFSKYTDPLRDASYSKVQGVGQFKPFTIDDNQYFRKRDY